MELTDRPLARLSDYYFAYLPETVHHICDSVISAPACRPPGVCLSGRLATDRLLSVAHLQKTVRCAISVLRLTARPSALPLTDRLSSRPSIDRLPPVV